MLSSRQFIQNINLSYFSNILIWNNIYRRIGLRITPFFIRILFYYSDWHRSQQLLSQFWEIKAKLLAQVVRLAAKVLAPSIKLCNRMSLTEFSCSKVICLGVFLPTLAFAVIPSMVNWASVCLVEGILGDFSLGFCFLDSLIDCCK